MQDNSPLSIEDLWLQHGASVFPKGLGGEEIGGIDLVMLDADIAGCVHTFLSAKRSLDARRLAILGLCYRDVSRVIPSIAIAHRPHFERLEVLAGSILREVASQD
jgi:hypothetical protein